MKYKINKFLTIEEKAKLDGKASGWIVYTKPQTTIQVKQNLQVEEKALVIIHELVHYIQYKMDDNNTQEAREEVAERVEKWIKDIIKKYPPFVEGLSKMGGIWKNIR